MTHPVGIHGFHGLVPGGRVDDRGTRFDSVPVDRSRCFAESISKTARLCVGDPPAVRDIAVHTAALWVDSAPFVAIARGIPAGVFRMIETLRALGYNGACRSVGEALICAYLQWGMSLDRKILGIALGAVWDGRRRRLTLLRGPDADDTIVYSPSGWFAHRPAGAYREPGPAVLRRGDVVALDELHCRPPEHLPRPARGTVRLEPSIARS